MSEADTPKSYPDSGNDYDAIDELIACEDDTDSSESLDELIASLDATETTSEADHLSESSFNDLFSFEEDAETGGQPLASDELQEQNYQLLQQNEELHKALAITQAELEEQQFRLRQAEDLNAQQNDEINAASEQNLSLSQELKNYRLQEQQHQEKITQLSHQLQVSQQRVAQLERECALIQKQFQEQSYQLSQAEKYSRDLSFRLEQQRRHTWQFKLALNKCLENNAEHHDLIPNSPASSQPIPAWSSQDKGVSLGKEQLLSMEESLIEEPDLISNSAEATEIEADWFMEEESPSTQVYGELETKTQSAKLTDNSPAPLLNSTRKKRQSYASVELPSFLR